MLNSSLCDYSDAYILAKETISTAQVLTPAESDNVGKEVVFKNCAAFTDCICEINNTQIDNARDIGVLDVLEVVILLMAYVIKYVSQVNQKI